MAILLRKGVFSVLVLSPLFLCLFVPLWALGAPAPETLTQVEAQALAAKANEIGSDQSLRSSATTAMQALVKFGDADIQGAFSTAYKAYGKFKNSENLDRLRKQGILTKAQMASGEGAGFTDAEAAFLGSSTSFRRLDPSFLSTGEEAKIAEEFEKKTGIKRGDFLAMLTAASENKLYVSDPKLAEKIDAEFDSFVKKIPNPEFRGKVESAMKLVPSLTRHKLIVQGVQKMVELAKDFKSTISPSAEAPKNPVSASAVTEEKSRKPTAMAQAEEEKAPAPPDEALPLTGTLNSDAMARAGDSGGRKNQLDGVVLDAVKFDAEKESIFQIVSRRYRLLTPGMLVRKEGKEL